MAIEPSREQLADLVEAAGGESDGPVVMLNLNRYRERAAYDGTPPGELPADVSGQEAYLRYGAVAAEVLGRVGGRILWHSESKRTVVGDDTDRYDEILAVWYPSLEAFAALVGDPGIVAALAHRSAGLERAAIICCDSGAEPVLTGF
jgi:uncharacterized protein (DUF1330 family)